MNTRDLLQAIVDEVDNPNEDVGNATALGAYIPEFNKLASELADAEYEYIQSAHDPYLAGAVGEAAKRLKDAAQRHLALLSKE